MSLAFLNPDGTTMIVEGATESAGRMAGVTLDRVGQELSRAHPQIERWGIVQEHRAARIRFWVRRGSGAPVSGVALEVARLALRQLMPRLNHDVVSP